MSKDFTLAHMSDLHLDYRTGLVINEQGINVREQDGYDTFHAIVDDIIAHDVDAATISGDIFHSPRPSIRAIVEAQKGLKKLAEAGIKVYSLAGNHDASDAKADIASSKVVDYPEIGIYSHVEPYVHYEIADGIHLHLVSHHMYGEQSETMMQVEPIPGEINIFSTHGSVIDSITQIKLTTEQSPREIIIPNFILNEKDWSYRLLGHIHERGFVGDTSGLGEDSAGLKTYYNGSIIRRGFSDKDNGLGRGWTLWTIKPDGTFEHEKKSFEQRYQRDFPSIDCEGMNSLEITDLLVEQLASTRDEHLPIIRQSLTNITPAQHSSLDWRTINQFSNHTLTWDIKREYATPEIFQSETTISENEEDYESEVARITMENTGDLVDVYDTWSQQSSVIDQLDESVKKRAVKTSREYIKKSKEQLLENS